MSILPFSPREAQAPVGPTVEADEALLWLCARTLALLDADWREGLLHCPAPSAWEAVRRTTTLDTEFAGLHLARASRTQPETVTRILWNERFDLVPWIRAEFAPVPLSPKPRCRRPRPWWLRLGRFAGLFLKAGVVVVPVLWDVIQATAWAYHALGGLC